MPKLWSEEELDEWAFDYEKICIRIATTLQWLVYNCRINNKRIK
jgi:hypothetical protein